jgi:retron-type reverse transcriptase
MKRHGNLWPEIISFTNLLKASRKAQRGKRFYPNVLEFNTQLETELLRLQEQQLINQTYRPGDYRTFQIFEPKPRLISAAPYRDRVVHHTLCNIICPLFEKSFIPDSYANRVGFGSHRALRRFTKFNRSSQLILQCDIKKYFPSIDHQILKNLIRQKIKCSNTLWLIELLIDHSNPQEASLDYFPGDNLLTPLERRKGLPIGNLTSQFFANVYLNGFDHFVKEKLKAKKYLRYVDDFAIFADDYDYLVNSKLAIQDYLNNLRLKIHPIKSQIFKTYYSCNFVGFRIFPDRIRVRNDNLRRARVRLKKLKNEYFTYKISLSKLIQRLQSWEAHLKHANSYKLRHSIFKYYTFSKN